MRPDTRITLRDPVTRRRVDAAIRELRKRRVSYRSIGEALDVFDGLRLTEGQVRHRCFKLGLTTKGDQRP